MTSLGGGQAASITEGAGRPGRVTWGQKGKAMRPREPTWHVCLGLGLPRAGLVTGLGHGRPLWELPLIDSSSRPWLYWPPRNNSLLAIRIGQEAKAKRNRLGSGGAAALRWEALKVEA